MSNLQTTQKNEVSTFVQNDVGMEVGADLLIPKALLMQSTSDLVTEGTFRIGEIIDSVSSELIAKAGEELQFVPFYVKKSWDVYKAKLPGTTPTANDYVRNEVRNQANDGLPWDDIEDNLPLKRVKRLDFYVLMKKDLDAGAALPKILSFKSTSYKEGQKLLNVMLVLNKMAKLQPYGKIVSVTTKKEQNDKGTWYVPTIKVHEATKQEYVDQVLPWIQLVASGAVKEHDENDVVAGAVVDATGTLTENGEQLF